MSVIERSLRGPSTAPPLSRDRTRSTCTPTRYATYASCCGRTICAGVGYSEFIARAVAVARAERPISRVTETP